VVVVLEFLQTGCASEEELEKCSGRRVELKKMISGAEFGLKERPSTLRSGRVFIEGGELKSEEK